MLSAEMVLQGHNAPMETKSPSCSVDKPVPSGFLVHEPTEGASGSSYINLLPFMQPITL